MSFRRLAPRTIANARTLRREATRFELILWKYLRGRRLENLRFRRQHPMADFILDFYCAEARLTVEIDGSGHVESAPDDVRTAELARLDVLVVRFWNHQVANELGSVLEKIRDTALERIR